MNEISDTELKKVFPCRLPEDMNQLARTTEQESPHDIEARIEAEKFRGKRWDEIDRALLKQCYDISLMLSPRSFHYYFPAFIKHSQVDIEQMALFVDTLLNLLADCGIHWPKALAQTEAVFLNDNPELKEMIEDIDVEKLSAWRKERWTLFSKQQWFLIHKWLCWIDKNSKYEIDRGVLGKAIENVELNLA